MLKTGVITLPFWGGYQTIEMYGNFQGFLYNSALFGLVNMMTPGEARLFGAYLRLLAIIHQ